MSNSDSSITRFTILVHGSPREPRSHLSAQKFIASVYRAKYEVSQVFFYGEAALICSDNVVSEDLPNTLQQQWLALSEKFHFQLQACISTAINRGIVDRHESEQSGQKMNLVKGFELEGLAVVAESISSSCQLIEFGCCSNA